MCIALAFASCQTPAGQQAPENDAEETLNVPACVVTTPPDSLKLDKFYTKYVDVNGLPLISSWRVPDSAFVAAHRTLYAMTSMLPEAVAWRQKEQFSDGVGYSWIDTLKEMTAAQVTDEQMAHAAERFPVNTPLCKEEYYYRSIFAEHFPSESAARSVPQEASVACSTAIAREWDEAFKQLNDPSGRAVAGVHEQAYA